MIDVIYDFVVNSGFKILVLILLMSEQLCFVTRYCYVIFYAYCDTLILISYPLFGSNGSFFFFFL